MRTLKRHYERVLLVLAATDALLLMIAILRLVGVEQKAIYRFFLLFAVIFGGLYFVVNLVFKRLEQASPF